MSDWGTPKAHDDPYWREQGKVWVEVSPGRKRLVDLTKPRPVRPKPANFPCPAIHSDNLLDPLQSMADGKWYDSKSEMFKSYKADGNPQGVEYTCVGDASVEDYSKPRTKTREDVEDMDRAIARALDETGAF